MVNAQLTAKDRARRLGDGCCPIHGLSMGQIGNDVIDGQHVFVVACPRKDCDVQATETEPYGVATLRPAWAHLVEPTLVG
jgi:hypothetical protein